MPGPWLTGSEASLSAVENPGERVVESPLHRSVLLSLGCGLNRLGSVKHPDAQAALQIMEAGSQGWARTGTSESLSAYTPRGREG